MDNDSFHCENLSLLVRYLGWLRLPLAASAPAARTPAARLIIICTIAARLFSTRRRGIYGRAPRTTSSDFLLVCYLETCMIFRLLVVPGA